MKVKKRNGEVVDFDKSKIVNAVEKAMKSSTGVYVEGQAQKIAENIEMWLILNKKDEESEISIYEIEKMVFNELVDMGNKSTAQAYESYKAIQSYKRSTNTIDNSIIKLLNRDNKGLMEENSNKNPILAATQRDLIAGEVSKDLAKRNILPLHLVEAHESGAIHIHDMDYMIQPIINCCLIDMKNMLDEGTVINGKMIESPKSFQVACNVMTQIIAHIASNQFGGQSVDISCLGKYLRKSYEKNLESCIEVISDLEEATKMAEKMTQVDLKSGIQTVQYQVNTLNLWGAAA